MSSFNRVTKVLEIVLFFTPTMLLAFGQAPGDDMKAEHDPARRSEMALTIADTAFDNARDFYIKGDFEKGDAQLEDMTNALNECVDSLSAAHKAKFYKRAELKVAYLQRRMQGLVDDIELQQRGWAEQTQRRLEEIHDKLLDGVMRK